MDSDATPRPARGQGSVPRADGERGVGDTTLSGVPVDEVYGTGELGAPGQAPFTRGPYASMYRDKLWTMRMFAGFGLAADTNRRFHELLAAGVTGLSTAFDMPTLMGRDSDHPWAVGEVGRAGVAVDTLADMDELFAGIDLGGVTTSMTINGPAVTVMAMYVAIADRRGTPRGALGGTIQNDILKEFQAQKEYIFPPVPSVRLVTDLMRFTRAELPRWHPVSVSGYHIREAGSTAAQELGVHPRQRLRLPGGRHPLRAQRRRGRPAHVVLLQRTLGLLRGDRQVPRRAADLGALAARALGRPRRARPAPALPRPDLGRVAHRPAAGGQHRPRRAAGAGRGARRAPSPCTPTPTTRRWRSRPSTPRAWRCEPSR